MWPYIVAAVLVLFLITYIVFAKQINEFFVILSGKKRIQRKLYRSCKANDYQIINDLYVPIDPTTYRYIDTLIFGNKYIYLITEIVDIGHIIVSDDDRKWRVINEKKINDKLKIIDNPFLYNNSVISKLIKVVPGLEINDFKNMAAVTKLSDFETSATKKNEYIVSEKDVIKTIIQIEKNSNEDIFDSYDIERYVAAFFRYGQEAEKVIKEQKGRTKQ